MDRPRAADDFATTRARIEELRRERQGEDSANRGLQSGQPRRGLAAIAPAPLPIAQNLGAVVAILGLAFHCPGLKRAQLFLGVVAFASSGDLPSFSV